VAKLFLVYRLKFKQYNWEKSKHFSKVWAWQFWSVCGRFCPIDRNLQD